MMRQLPLASAMLKPLKWLAYYQEIVAIKTGKYAFMAWGMCWLCALKREWS